MTSLEYSNEQVQEWIEQFKNGGTISEIAERAGASPSQVAVRIRELEQSSLYQSKEQEVEELMENIRSGNIFITGGTDSREERKRVILRLARAFERRGVGPMERKHAVSLANDESLGVSASTVDNLLDELVDDSKLERKEQGKYLLSHSQKNRKPVQALFAYINGTNNSEQALSGVQQWKGLYLNQEFPERADEVSEELNIYEDVLQIITSLSNLEELHNEGEILVSRDGWGYYELEELAKFGFVDKMQEGYSLNAEGSNLLGRFRKAVQ